MSNRQVCLDLIALGLRGLRELGDVDTKSAANMISKLENPPLVANGEFGTPLVATAPYKADQARKTREFQKLVDSAIGLDRKAAFRSVTDELADDFNKMVDENDAAKGPGPEDMLDMADAAEGEGFPLPGEEVFDTMGALAKLKSPFPAAPLQCDQMQSYQHDETGRVAERRCIRLADHPELHAWPEIGPRWSVIEELCDWKHTVGPCWKFKGHAGLHETRTHAGDPPKEPA